MLRLQIEREKQGLSRTQLAYLARIHPVFIGRLERRELKPFPGWRRRLAEALGWPVERADELFEEMG